MNIEVLKNMKNYKKTLILTFLLIVVAGFAINTVDAATMKTGKINFKYEKFVSKHAGKGDYLCVYYTKKGSGGQGFYPPNTMLICVETKKESDGKYYKIDKATVKFSKKENNKILYSTKTFKSVIDDFGLENIKYHPKNGYKPIYAIITYKNK
jgi:hypothetical protein